MVPLGIKRRIRRAAALLLAVMLLGAFPAGAFASEGDGPGTYTVADGEPPGDFTPDVPPMDDPSSDEPPDSSDPEPPSSSTPSDDPSSSEPGDDDPDDPSSSEPEDDSSSEPENTGPVVTPRPTPKSGGSTISRPQTTRPKLTLNTSSSSSAAPDSSAPKEPNYITFVRLNQKANSMSMTLFYGGAGCILFGVLGLLLLLALFIHNRRVDSRDGIFEEIAVAEQRYPGPYPPQAGGYAEPPVQQPVQPRPAARPQAIPPQQPPYYEPAPSKANLYTEEFDALSQDALYYDDYDYAPPPQDSLYTEEFELPDRQAPAPYAAYKAPAQDSLYTEEFELPELPLTPAAPVRREPPAYTAPSPAPAERSSYDTDEILRELLGKDYRQR